MATLTMGAAALALLTCSAPAHATYSVVAVDSRLQHVGGAGTSCVGALDVAIILGVAPGFGAVHAQALINTAGRDLAVMRLEEGLSPQAILDELTGPAFDVQAARRQYGVVSLAGLAAGFTGETNGAFAGDRQGTAAPFSYSVQGNILTGEAVLDGAEAAFVRGGGCDMPDRLMLALEAGAANGEGDSRCTPDGIPADSAFMRVVDANGLVVVDLSVTDTAPQNPMVPLRQAFDAWRLEHPCPAEPPSGSTGGTDTGGASTSTSTSTSTTSSTGPATPETTAAASTSAPTPPGTTASQTSDAAAEGSPGAMEQPGGCACSSAPAHRAVPLWLFGAFAISRRRRLGRSRRRAGRTSASS
ncbi:MAG: DUF1028 domain-containing protein [Myxococcota bacterium]